MSESVIVISITVETVKPSVPGAQVTIAKQPDETLDEFVARIRQRIVRLLPLSLPKP